MEEKNETGIGAGQSVEGMLNSSSAVCFPFFGSNGMLQSSKRNDFLRASVYLVSSGRGAECTFSAKALIHAQAFPLLRIRYTRLVLSEKRNILVCTLAGR